MQWLAFASLVEFFVFIFPAWQALILLVIAAVFLFKFLSDLFNRYSGRRKAMNVDLFSFCLSLALAAFATGLKPANITILILVPLLILPRVIFIIKD